MHYNDIIITTYSNHKGLNMMKSSSIPARVICEELEQTLDMRYGLFLYNISIKNSNDIFSCYDQDGNEVKCVATDIIKFEFGTKAYIDFHVEDFGYTMDEYLNGKINLDDSSNIEREYVDVINVIVDELTEHVSENTIDYIVENIIYPVKNMRHSISYDKNVMQEFIEDGQDTCTRVYVKCKLLVGTL